MTGRVLRRLESAGIVTRIGRGRLRLLDAAALAAAAEDHGDRDITAEARTQSTARRRTMG
jgi:hypothetical protein